MPNRSLQVGLFVIVTLALSGAASAQSVTLDIGERGVVESPYIFGAEPSDLLRMPISNDVLGELFAPEWAAGVAPFNAEIAEQVLERRSGLRPEAETVARAAIARARGDLDGAAELLMAVGIPDFEERWCTAAEVLLVPETPRTNPIERLEAMWDAICDDSVRPSSRHSDEILVMVADRAFRSLDRGEALEMLEHGLDRVDLHSEAWCEVSISYARTLERVGRQAEADLVIDEVVANCAHSPNAHIRALYNRMVAGAEAGSGRTTREFGEQILSLYPDRSHADDVLFWMAVEDGDRAVELAQRAIEEFPDGDMVGRLILLAADELEGMDRVSFLGEIANSAWHDPAYQTAGRLELELARTCDPEANPGCDCSWFRALVDRYPYAYTVTMAQRDPDLLECDVMTPTIDASSTLEVDVDDEHLAEALSAWIALGAYGPALEAIEAVEPMTDELRWLAAGLQAAMGDTFESHGSIRWGIYGWERDTPLSDGARWRIGYPAPHVSEVEFAVEESGVDPATIYAIMREESAFRPAVQSHAGARGLMQLMPATARENAGYIGERYRLRYLDDPAFNIRLGANVLRRGFASFGDDLARVSAGYNAGRGRVRQWDDRRGDEEDVDWIEAIPFTETRNYVRRVLQSERVYAMWLP